MEAVEAGFSCRGYQISSSVKLRKMGHKLKCSWPVNMLSVGGFGQAAAQHSGPGLQSKLAQV